MSESNLGGGEGGQLTRLRHSTLFLPLVSIVSLKLFEILLPSLAQLFSCVSKIINHRIFFSRTLSFIDVEESGLLEIHAMSSSIFFTLISQVLFPSF